MWSFSWSFSTRVIVKLLNQSLLYFVFGACLSTKLKVNFSTDCFWPRPNMCEIFCKMPRNLSSNLQSKYLRLDFKITSDARITIVCRYLWLHTLQCQTKAEMYEWQLHSTASYILMYFYTCNVCHTTPTLGDWSWKLVMLWANVKGMRWYNNEKLTSHSLLDGPACQLLLATWSLSMCDQVTQLTDFVVGEPDYSQCAHFKDAQTVTHVLLFAHLWSDSILYWHIAWLSPWHVAWLCITSCKIQR